VAAHAYTTEKLGSKHQWGRAECQSNCAIKTIDRAPRKLAVLSSGCELPPVVKASSIGGACAATTCLTAVSHAFNTARVSLTPGHHELEMQLEAACPQLNVGSPHFAGKFEVCQAL
jgi:hypothetical protein